MMTVQDYHKTSVNKSDLRLDIAFCFLNHYKLNVIFKVQKSQIKVLMKLFFGFG